MTPTSIWFEVRRSDFASMYLGSWAARITMAPGLLAILVGIPTNPKYPLSEALFFMALGAFALVAGPLLLCWFLMGMYGTSAVVGKTVHLVVDDEGIRGWPIAEYVDTSWEHAGRARRMYGVITVPFHQFGTRAGWVPIPERAINPDQRDQILGLLTARAGLRPFKHRS